MPSWPNRRNGRLTAGAPPRSTGGRRTPSTPGRKRRYPRPMIERIRRAVPGMAVVAAAALALALTPAIRAQAGLLEDEDQGPGATCFMDQDLTLSPGLSVTPSSGTYATPAAGVLECHGKINGQDPKGDGQVTEEGRYGTKDPDTCQTGGEGEGRYFLTIPTSAGVRKFVAVITFTYGEPSTRGGVVAGKVHGNGLSGTFDATPKEGDCVTKPVTKIHTVNEIHF